MDEQQNTSTQGATTSEDTIRLDVNRAIVGKVKEDFYELHTGFQTEEVTVPELALGVIRAGHAYTAPFAKVPDDRHQTCHFKDNVESVSLLWLDVETGDERSTLEWWSTEPLVRKYAAIVHTTSSDREDDPHCRVIFRLEEPLSVQEGEVALKALFAMFPFVDQSVHDAGRVLYGAEGCTAVVLDRVLPADVLHREVTAPYEAALEAEKEDIVATVRRMDAELRDASDGRTSDYVWATFERVTDELSSAQEGTGARHKLLLTASVRLHSLAMADWLDQASKDCAEDVEGWLLDAARANGYASKYGEEDTRRIIESGKDLATPAIMPRWKERQDFFEPGDYVTASLPGCRQAGHVTAVKKDQNAWLYELDTRPRVWWPRSALQHAGQDEDEDEEPLELSDEEVKQLRKCLDCKEDTSAAGLREYYVVHDDVWLEAQPERHGMLCVGCLETRLARRLTPNDFQDCVVNEWNLKIPSCASDRLLSRVAGQDAAAQSHQDDEGGDGSTNTPEVEPSNTPETPGSPLCGNTTGKPPPPETPADFWQHMEEEALGGHSVMAVTVPAGQYLSDVDFELPERAVLDANTGIGKTTYAATCGEKSERVVVTMSSIVALLQQAMRHPSAGVCYEHEKTVTPSTRLAFVTYDQLPAVAKLYEEWGMDFASVRLFVDEQHNLALADYRRKALDNLLRVVAGYDWKSVTFMSGTPLKVPHSTLDDFQYVKVNSHRRTQKATVVHWKRQDDEGNSSGRKRNTIVELVRRHKRVLVHLDNKGAELDGLVAALVASGLDLATIYTLNSDNKYEALGQQVTEHETVPDDCRVLIVTSVFVESSNMRTYFDAGIIASPIHPSYAQQFANRQRGDSPMDMAYVLHGGTGSGWSFDIGAELDHTRRLAQQLADTLNAIEETRATITEDARRVFGGEYGALVRRSGERFVVDELGVAQHVHRSASLYANQNASCYKAMTRSYGWQWLDDEVLVVTDSNKPAAQRKQERQLRQEYAELAKADWQARVAYVHELGQSRAENERFLAMHHSKVMRTIERALELYKLTEDWTEACALLATASDSTQSFNKLKRMLAADKLSASGDTFVEDIRNAFWLGKAYTQDERHQTLVEVYLAHDTMRPFVTEVYPYSWSQEPRAKVDKRTADDMLRLVFSVKEQRVRIGGQQVRQWTFIGHTPLEELLSVGHAKLEEAIGQRQNANAVFVPPNYVISKATSEFSGTEEALVEPGSYSLEQFLDEAPVIGR